MFTNQYNHTIDAKGRLIIPTKYREALGDEFVVTKGLDGCLFVYGNDDWESFYEKMSDLPIIDDEARDFARFFLAGATTVEVDKQGRILLPSTLREFATLDKDVVLAGVGGHIEIWDKDTWDHRNATMDIRKVTAGMKALGLKI